MQVGRVVLYLMRKDFFMSKRIKTNVMRILDSAGISYNVYSDNLGAVSGAEAAAAMGKPPEQVFKTLVTKSKSGEHYVFMIPVAHELDLKKAAASAGEKSLSMIPQKELLPTTGYVHGGCSPIGMKKSFVTTADISAQNLESIIFSAGKIGVRVEVSPNDLKKLVGLRFAALT